MINRSLFRLHSIYYIVYAIVAFNLALAPMSAHFWHFNPLVQRKQNQTFWAGLVWYLWLFSNVGWLANLVASLVSNSLR